MAEAAVASPHDWKPRGGVLLAPQPDSPFNCRGPSFPFVVPRDDGPWLMAYCGWGASRTDGTLANTTGLALSDDAGLTWRYMATPEQQWPLGTSNPSGVNFNTDYLRDYDCSATGSVSIVRGSGPTVTTSTGADKSGAVGYDDDDNYRMYYTCFGPWSAKPEGVQTGHGDHIPRVGIALALSSGQSQSASNSHKHSSSSVNDFTGPWRKPLDRLLVAPRGLAFADSGLPFEYINSKPFVLHDTTSGW